MNNSSNTLVLNPKKPGERANALDIIGRILSAIPALMIVAGVVLALVLPVRYSFTEWNLLDEANSVGNGNYVNLFTQDWLFTTALTNSLWDLLIIGLGGFLVCLLISLLIRTLPRAVKYAVIVLLLTPLVCPGLWNLIRWAFAGNSSALCNGLLIHIGVISEPLLYLDMANCIPYIVRGVQFLRSIGPGVLIISAGLDSVRRSVLEESRQRGMRSHFGVFWGITLRRMRLPLMLAAVVMVMGAMGTSTVSAKLVGLNDASYSSYTLWTYILDYVSTRNEVGYAAAILCVTNALELLAMLVMCGAIFLLTLRPSAWRCRKLPEPQRARGLTSGWNAWRVLWTLIGAFVAQVFVLLPAFLLFVEGNRAFMPMDELFRYPPRIVVENPSLINFDNMLSMHRNSAVSVWDESLGAVLMPLIPMMLMAGLAGLIGYGLSHRRLRGIRVLMMVCMVTALLCSPIAKYVDMLLPHSRTAKIEFTEPLTRLLWAFVPVSLALGLSFGEMCRRKRPVRRVVMAGAGFGCLVLYLCVLGSLAKYFGQINIRGVAEGGAASASGLLLDTISLLLLIPIVMGAFQMLSGLGDLRPLYRGGEE